MTMNHDFGDVMISYAWDSSDPAHQPWVIALDTKLRNLGFSTTLDVRSVPLVGAGDINLWMERAVRNAKWIIAVVTAKYAQKCDDRDNGNSLGYEISQIIERFVNTGRNNHIISVLRPSAHGNPQFIPLALWIDFREDAKFEEKFSDLVRRLKGSPSTPDESILKVAEKADLTATKKENYQNIGEIPLDCWRANSSRSEFLCSSNPNFGIKIKRQPDWSVSDEWALKSLGPGAYRVSVILRQMKQESIFDFASDVRGRSFLPFPENVNGKLEIGYVPNWVAKILNHSTSNEPYESLKFSAGIQ